MTTAQALRYSRLQVSLHWLTLLLLLISFFSHEGMKAVWRTVEQGGTATMTTPAALHVWVGVAVLILTAIRLAARLVLGVPPEIEGQPKFQVLLAKVTHVGLYVLLFAIPASGALAWFGGFEDVGELHEIFFNAALALVGLHVVGAIYHQFVLKDGLLSRMR